MNAIDFNIPHRSASFGNNELYFSSLAGVAHLAYGTALAIYNLVVYTYSLITKGHFFPQYETAWEAANDIQPWQHLGRGAILLIPLVGSIFFSFYDRQIRKDLKLQYYNLATALLKHDDPERLLIIDLFALSYIHREHHECTESQFSNDISGMKPQEILRQCLDWGLNDYAPKLSLMLIESIIAYISVSSLDPEIVASDEIRTAIPEGTAHKALYTSLTQCTELLALLTSSNPEFKTHPAFQRGFEASWRLYTLLQRIDERHAIFGDEAAQRFKATLALQKAQLLEARSTLEEDNEVKNAFFEAGNLYEAYLESISSINSANYAKTANCFEKGGDAEKAEYYHRRAEEAHQASPHAPNPNDLEPALPTIPLIPLWQE